MCIRAYSDQMYERHTATPIGSWRVYANFASFVYRVGVILRECLQSEPEYTYLDGFAVILIGPPGEVTEVSNDTSYVHSFRMIVLFSYRWLSSSTRRRSATYPHRELLKLKARLHAFPGGQQAYLVSGLVRTRAF